MYLRQVWRAISQIGVLIETTLYVLQLKGAAVTELM